VAINYRYSFFNKAGIKEKQNIDFFISTNNDVKNDKRGEYAHPFFSLHSFWLECNQKDELFLLNKCNLFKIL